MRSKIFTQEKRKQEETRLKISMKMTILKTSSPINFPDNSVDNNRDLIKNSPNIESLYGNY